MQADEFGSWRQRVGLTQDKAAEKLGVTRTTIQNWETGIRPIPQSVDASCDLWEHRLKQESASLGPVTLIYSDGPMFVNPYGPRRRLAMMKQEAYPTNAAAIARVQQLWGRDDFHNAMIIELSGKPLWNVVELARVVDGNDTGAPTRFNTISALAKYVKANSHLFVRNGPKTYAPSEAKDRQRRIEGLAAELDKLAAAGPEENVRYQQIEQALSKLHSLGFHPTDLLVSNVAHALQANPSYRITTEGEASMHINSTEFLKLMAENDCYILLERATPVGRLKRDFISIKSRDGRDFELRTPTGYRACPVQLPRDTLDDYLRASLVSQDGPADAEGSVIYRLTQDGRERGLS
jgi:hypothetical protein